MTTTRAPGAGSTLTAPGQTPAAGVGGEAHPSAGNPRIGSLCTGYGGLDRAVEMVLGGELAWVADNDPGAAAILAHRFPSVPNHGDIAGMDWAAVEPVDILTAGFPCQDLSYAGRGEGIQEGNRSGIWYTVADAMGVLRPRLVVLENVAAIVGRRPGLDVVAASLAALGFDAEWLCLRASDAGAPHQRDRWFCVAADTRGGGVQRRGIAGVLDSPQRASASTRDQRERHGDASDDSRQDAAHADRAAGREWWLSAPGQAEGRRPRPDARGRSGAPAADTHGAAGRRHEPRSGPGAIQGPAVAERAPEQPGRLHSRDRDQGALASADTDSDGLPWGEERDSEPAIGRPGHEQRRVDPLRRVLDWGNYAPAIHRWEAVLGRPAPRPTEPGRTGERLAPRFVEWMQGLPAGWVTDVPGLSRNAQLKALGNGVVPAQAALALSLLLSQARNEVAA